MNQSQIINAGKIDRSIRRFMDYSQDVLNSDMNTFADRIQVLMSYCESDMVFSVIHKQLVNEDPAKYKEWLEERNSTVKGMVGSGELKFPNNLNDRIKTMYWLLREVYVGNLDVVDFSHNFFASQSRSVNDRVSFFTDTVLAPLERELIYRFNDLIESIKNKDETISASDLDMFPSSGTQINKGIESSEIASKVSNSSLSKTTNISSSLRFNAINLIESAKEYRELVRGHNLLTAEHPEEKEKILEFISFVEQAAFELDRIVPEDDSAGLPSDNDKIKNWMERFWNESQSNFNELFTPEKMSGLVVPSTLILGLGAIGGLIGGPAGFGVGSLAGQFLSGHVKAGKLSEEIGKGFQE